MLMSACVRGIKHTRNCSLQKYKDILSLITLRENMHRHWTRMNLSSVDNTIMGFIVFSPVTLLHLCPVQALCNLCIKNEVYFGLTSVFFVKGESSFGKVGGIGWNNFCNVFMSISNPCNDRSVVDQSKSFVQLLKGCQRQDTPYFAAKYLTLHHHHHHHHQKKVLMAKEKGPSPN